MGVDGKQSPPRNPKSAFPSPVEPCVLITSRSMWCGTYPACRGKTRFCRLITSDKSSGFFCLAVMAGALDSSVLDACLSHRCCAPACRVLLCHDLTVSTGHGAELTTWKAVVCGTCPARLVRFFAPITMRPAPVSCLTRRISSTGLPETTL